MGDITGVPIYRDTLDNDTITGTHPCRDDISRYEQKSLLRKNSNVFRSKTLVSDAKMDIYGKINVFVMEVAILTHRTLPD